MRIWRLFVLPLLLWSLLLSGCQPIRAGLTEERVALAVTLQRQLPDGAPVRSPSPRRAEEQVAEIAPARTPEPVPRQPDGNGPLVWSRQEIYDPVAEQDAFTVWVPQGWTLAGTVQYNPVPSLAIMSLFHVHNPVEHAGAETISSEMQLAWTEGPGGPAVEGDTYFGNFIERPKDGINYFQQNLLPILRQEYPDYQVLELQRDSDSIEALRRLHELELSSGMLRELGGEVEFDAIAVRALYTVNGQTIEDSFHAQFQYVALQMGMMQSVTWGLIWAERLYAPQGSLKEQTPLLKAIARSARPNYNWYYAVETHRYQVWNIAVSAQRAWDDYIAYQNERMAKYDEIYAGFTHYLRGTDIKQNPITGEQWELPDLYRHIWFSRDGRILFTDIDGYDPNSDQALGGTWEEASG